MNSSLANINFVYFALAFFSSAFFSASEAAFLSLGRVSQNRLNRKQNFFPRIATYLYARFNKLFFVIVACNLTANVLATFFAAENFQFFLPVIQQKIPFFVSPFSDISFIVIYTFFILIFAEFFPKKIAIQYSSHLVLLFGLPLLVVYVFFSPLLMAFDRFVIRRKNGEGKNQGMSIGGKKMDAYSSLAFSHKEMLGYIEQGKKTGALHVTESSLLESVVEYFGIPVKALMIPREKIKGVEYSELRKKNVIEKLKKFPHINIPIYKKQKDDIVGVISKRDLFTKYRSEKIKKGFFEPFIINPPILPESKKIVDVFIDICKAECELALLTDEFGGVEGMVTYEDIVAEIFKKKHNIAEGKNSIRNLGSGYFLISGEVRLNELNQFFSVNLQCDSAETLAGYLLEQIKHFPKKKEVFFDSMFRYKIQKCDQRRILEVLLIRKKK